MDERYIHKRKTEKELREILLTRNVIVVDRMTDMSLKSNPSDCYLLHFGVVYALYFIDKNGKQFEYIGKTYIEENFAHLIMESKL